MGSESKFYDIFRHSTATLEKLNHGKELSEYKIGSREDLTVLKPGLIIATARDKKKEWIACRVQKIVRIKDKSQTEVFAQVGICYKNYDLLHRVPKTFKKAIRDETLRDRILVSMDIVELLELSLGYMEPLWLDVGLIDSDLSVSAFDDKATIVNEFPVQDGFHIRWNYNPTTEELTGFTPKICCMDGYAYCAYDELQVYCRHCKKWQCIGCTEPIPVNDNTTRGRQFAWESLTLESDHGVLFDYLCSPEALIVRGTDRRNDPNWPNTPEDDSKFVDDRTWQIGGSGAFIERAISMRAELVAVPDGRQRQPPEDWIVRVMGSAHNDPKVPLEEYLEIVREMKEIKCRWCRRELFALEVNGKKKEEVKVEFPVEAFPVQHNGTSGRKRGLSEAGETKGFRSTRKRARPLTSDNPSESKANAKSEYPTSETRGQSHSTITTQSHLQHIPSSLIRSSPDPRSISGLTQLRIEELLEAHVNAMKVEDGHGISDAHQVPVKME